MRNPLLDIMKAIGIFLVIIGHNIQGVGYHYIYSFHMPMFFIIAGYFYKERNIVQSVKHDFIRILIPYFVYLVMIAVLGYITRGISLGRVISDILKILWGSVVRIDVLGHHVQGIGYIWFLPALFTCKNVFNALYVWRKRSNEKLSHIFYICVIVLVSLGILIHKQLFPLPFALTTGLNALGYFTIGYIIRSWFKDISVVDNIAWYFRSLIVVVYVAIGWYTLNGMGTCDYSFLPLDYVAGISGTITCYYFSEWLNKVSKYMGNVLSIIGQYTISILIIHQFIASYAGTINLQGKHVLLVLITICIAVLYIFVHYSINSRCKSVK